MNSLEGILKLADTELDAINKAGKFRSREEIDSVYKLIDIAKDIYCIWDYDSEDEMSYDGGSYRGSYRDGSYDGGSYARGRGRNARRDSMGRYARDSYRGGSRDSYRRGYSRDDREEYMAQLRDMMENAPDDQTRQSLQRMVQQMEQG